MTTARATTAPRPRSRAAEAQVAAADAAIGTARVAGRSARRRRVEAALATIERIQADIDDSTLKSPRDGRVQYRVAQPGEVLGAGGRVLNLVDLTDVYMTFFLPTAAAGRVALGAEVRLVLDAAPQYVIPARASFVADVAQFTPKTVETAQRAREADVPRQGADPRRAAQEAHRRRSRPDCPAWPMCGSIPEREWPAHLAVKLPQ